MLRRALKVAMFLLAGMLFPQHSWAASSAQFGVSLVIRDACEIRSGSNGAVIGMPQVNCLHGQPYAISRARLEQPSGTRPVPATIERPRSDTGTTETWVVTF